MTGVPTPAPRCARLRARVAARAATQSGEALIEVLVTAMLVALVSGAILTAYAQVGHLAGNQRSRVEAASLAQQDEARLRGLTITQLSATATATSYSTATAGNTSYQVTVDGFTYTITSTAKFISGTSAGAACTTGPAVSTADEVQTTSSVTWPGNHTPVILHGVVTPDEGGSMVVTAVTPSGATGSTGLAGVTATLSGPTTVSPLTTDSNGCAVFGGLDGGSYTVSFSDPGYVDVNGNTPAASQALTVVPTETAQTTQLDLAQPGTISATYSTKYTNGGSTVSEAATDDQFVAINSGISAGYRTFGTDSTSSSSNFASTVSSGATLFPFSSGYVTYAGGCSNSTPAAGQASATVTSGTTASVVLPEPAMIVLPEVAAGSATEIDDPASSSNGVAVSYTGTWAHNTSVAGDYNSTESDSSTTNSTVTFTVPALSGGTTSNGGASSISWIATKANGNGKASVTLDGTNVGTVDLYSSSTSQQQTVYTTPALDPSVSHTLVITVAGTKNSSSTGYQIAIDAFKYTGSVLETTPKADVTVTDSVCHDEDYPPSANAPINATTGALANPGLPYGTYTVCVDNGTNHDTVSGVANTSYTGSNYAYAYIQSSASGYGTGKCT